MAGSIISVEGVLTDFLTLILPKIFGETMKEALIKIHHLISSNTEFISSNLGRVLPFYMALTMAADDYLSQMGHAFASRHNLGNYPPTLGTAQE